MRLTKYLNVLDESFDIETIRIMESLDVSTYHHEAFYEKEDHPFFEIGKVFVNITPIQYWTTLKLAPHTPIKEEKKEKYKNLVYLGLVYEVRIVRLTGNELRNLIEVETEIEKTQKILGRSLFLKCLTPKCNLIYCQISLPTTDTIEAKEDWDGVIEEFFNKNFQLLR